jgi:hypothetical protein
MRTYKILPLIVCLVLTAGLAEAKDLRPLRIERFLERYCPSSPLRGYGGEIVRQSDRYKLDYRLYVAIAGAESTWGKRSPKRSRNYTGISNGGARFRSIKHNIEFTLATIAEKKWYRKFRRTKNLRDLVVVYKTIPPFDRYQRSLNFTMDMVAGIPAAELAGLKAAALPEPKPAQKTSWLKKLVTREKPDLIKLWNTVRFDRYPVRKLNRAGL